MKGILPKEIGLGCSFTLNRLGKFAEQPVEGSSRREFDHDRLGDQLSYRLSLGGPSCPVVLFGGVQGCEEFSSIEAD